MSRLMVRLLLLAAGLGLLEIGLMPATDASSAFAWLPLPIGLILLVAGSAGFMIPIFSARCDKEQRR